MHLKLLRIIVLYSLFIACQKTSNNQNESNLNSSFIDIDGNYLPVVNVGGKMWMQKNLNVSRFRNGDPIPKIESNWGVSRSPAFCFYNNDSSTYASTYGRLYNWQAINDPRGLAPEGWHVATIKEWNEITNCIGCISYGLSDTSILWETQFASTDNSKFKGLPAGARDINGNFIDIRKSAVWWTSTEVSTNSAWYIWLNNNRIIHKDYTYTKEWGFAVRCVKNY
jgi:uncharacterized protein (TIGR02145 family)